MTSVKTREFARSGQQILAAKWISQKTYPKLYSHFASCENRGEVGDELVRLANAGLTNDSTELTKKLVEFFVKIDRGESPDPKTFFTSVMGPLQDVVNVLQAEGRI